MKKFLVEFEYKLNAIANNSERLKTYERDRGHAPAYAEKIQKNGC